MARKTKEDSEKTREMLIDAAEHVFISKGVSSASLEEIAQSAGVTRGALYWYFENKADLLNAVHHRAKAPLDAVFEGALQEGKDPIDALRGSTTAALRMIARDERMRNIFTILLFKCEQADQLSLQDGCPAQKRSEALEKFTRVFVDAHTKGQLVEGITPESAAFALHAYIYGIFSDYLRYPQGPDLYALAPDLMDVFFRGILRPLHGRAQAG